MYRGVGYILPSTAKALLGLFCYSNQARNQLGTPCGAKSWEGPKFFKLFPIFLNDVQHIFPGERIFPRGTPLLMGLLLLLIFRSVFVTFVEKYFDLFVYTAVRVPLPRKQDLIFGILCWSIDKSCKFHRNDVINFEWHFFILYWRRQAFPFIVQSCMTMSGYYAFHVELFQFQSWF